VRMFHYFAIAVAMVVPALLATTWLGVSGQVETHFKVALVTAIGTVGVHSLLILFMILTGRILREAMRARELSPVFLGELNEFFARKAAYPAALLGAVAIVVAGVLSMAQREFGWSTATHMVAGVGALLVNFWAFPLELKALRQNQDLVDRVAGELDRIDHDLEQSGELPVEALPDPAAIARGAFIVGVSAWMPYLYWAMVVWRGDFTQVSIHPWVELSALGFLAWWLVRKAEHPAEATPD
jgi:hypothetical protein